MVAPPYSVVPTESFLHTVLALAASPSNRVRLKKLQKAQRLLAQQGPQYPSLATHQIRDRTGPHGEAVYQSYVENRTPSAWRLWWIHGPNEDQITLLDAGPHP